MERRTPLRRGCACELVALHASLGLDARVRRPRGRVSRRRRVRAAGRLPRGALERGLHRLPDRILLALSPDVLRQRRDGPRRGPAVAADRGRHRLPGPGQHARRARRRLRTSSSSTASGSRTTTSSGPSRLSPSRILSSFEVDADYGEQADVDNLRVGHGGTLSVSAQVRPTQHLGLDLLAQRRWIDESRRHALGPGADRERRPRQGHVRVHAAHADPPHRAVHRDGPGSGLLRPAGHGEGAVASRARSSSPTSSTGRRSSSSATATTARWSRTAAWCALTGSSSSRSPTRFSDELGLRTGRCAAHPKGEGKSPNLPLRLNGSKP